MTFEHSTAEVACLTRIKKKKKSGSVRTGRIHSLKNFVGVNTNENASGGNALNR